VIQGFQMEALMARFHLSGAKWSIISPLLPTAEGKKNGPPGPDDRKVLNGIFFRVANGHAHARPAGTLRSLARRCTIASIAGLRRAYGHEYSRLWRRATSTPLAVKMGPDHAIGRSRGLGAWSASLNARAACPAAGSVIRQNSRGERFEVTI
jgi:transposase